MIWALSIATLGLLSVGCTADSGDELLVESGYGYARFKLYKHASYTPAEEQMEKQSTPTRATDGRLDYLREAYKVQVTLGYDENYERTIIQTLTLANDGSEVGEWGLRSDKIKLLVGAYKLHGFVLYDAEDNSLGSYAPTIENTFEVVEGGLTVQDITVDVPQRHIVKSFKDGCIHIIAAAHGDLLGLAAGGAGDKLVGHKHIAAIVTDGHMCNGAAERISIGDDFLIGIKAANMAGLDEGQQVDVHVAMGITKGNGRNGAVVDRRKIHAAGSYQPGTEGNALRRIMVTADDEHIQLLFGKPGKEIVQQGDGFRWWNGLVVEVAGDDHRIGTLLNGDLQDLVQDIGLILQKGKLAQSFAQVEIGKVHQLHGKTSLCECIVAHACGYHSYQRTPAWFYGNARWDKSQGERRPEKGVEA